MKKRFLFWLYREFWKLVHLQLQSVHLAYRFIGIFLTGAIVIILVNWPYSVSLNYSVRQLIDASVYVQNLSADTTIFLYPDDQPTTRIYGSAEFLDYTSATLKENRPGRYRRAWGTEEIAIVAVNDFFTADAGKRKSQIQALPLRDFIKNDLLSLPQSHVGCFARNFSQFGWAIGGYVIVDLGYLRAHSESYKDCVLTGFDTLDGLPVSHNFFELAQLPEQDVRRAVMDYVRLCSHKGISDARPPVRSRYGVSSLPSLECVADELSLLNSAQN